MSWNHVSKNPPPLQIPLWIYDTEHGVVSGWAEFSDELRMAGNELSEGKPILLFNATHWQIRPLIPIPDPPEENNDDQI